MDRGLTRTVNGEEEWLCWRFGAHGKTEPTYERASVQMGPYDHDRQRRLKRGETFRRLDAAGAPREYQGLCWRPKSSFVRADPETNHEEARYPIKD